MSLEQQTELDDRAKEVLDLIKRVGPGGKFDEYVAHGLQKGFFTQEKVDIAIQEELDNRAREVLDLIKKAGPGGKFDEYVAHGLQREFFTQKEVDIAIQDYETNIASPEAVGRFVDNRDYSKKGPCCDYQVQLKTKYIGYLRGLFVLTGGLPRTTYQIYGKLVPSIISGPLLSFALSEKCWCHDHPNPPLFRRFFEKLLFYKEKGVIPDDIASRLDLLEQLAGAALDEHRKL